MAGAETCSQVMVPYWFSRLSIARYRAGTATERPENSVSFRSTSPFLSRNMS